MEPSEAAESQPEHVGDALAEPGQDPAVELPEVNLQACELDSLEIFLNTNGSELTHCAENWLRRIPTKARRSRERPTLALLERWARPDCRLYVTLARLGLAVLPEVAGFFPPNALRWWAHAAGLEPQQGRRMCEQNDRPGSQLTTTAGELDGAGDLRGSFDLPADLHGLAGGISVGQPGRRVAPQGCDAQRQDGPQGVWSHPGRDHRGNPGWSTPISPELDPWEPLVKTPAPRGRGSHEQHL